MPSLKADAVRSDYNCDRTPRFGVRMTKHGTKTFFVFVGTPRRRASLGKYPATSLKDARLADKRLLASPLAEPGSISLGDAFAAYAEQVERIERQSSQNRGDRAETLAAGPKGAVPWRERETLRAQVACQLTIGDGAPGGPSLAHASTGPEP